jgi:deoxyadenosine/deoxycytidine kinase
MPPGVRITTWCPVNQKNKMSAELKERLKDYPVTVGVLGAIGSGKSLMANVLAEKLGLMRIEENFPQNPFLVDFYSDPKRYSFRSQVWFLKSTVDQLIEVGRVEQARSVILDPANEMNLIFAETHYKMGWMGSREIKLYKELYSILTEKGEIKKPDLFLWLDAPTPILFDRIKARGRHFETGILTNYPNYLNELSASVSEFASKRNARVVYVDSTGNFNNPSSLDGLIEKLKRGIVF